jgi:TolB-like protein
MAVSAGALNGTPNAPYSDDRLVIATADLYGSDHELGKFLADSLITDLSRSKALQPLERATVQECFVKLAFAADKALTAGDVRKIGAAAEADRVVVGSYMVRNDTIVINVRVLDAKTGLVVPGGAMSISGSHNELLKITHKLARQLHKQLTSTDLLIEDSEPATTTPLIAGTVESATKQPNPAVDDLQVLKSQGLIPVNARANAPLTDADLSTLVKNVCKCVTLQSETAATLSQTSGPVTRVRALAALVKLLVSPDDLANYRSAPPNRMPSDVGQLPIWGEPFLAAAVDQDWWPSDRQFCGKDIATWAFVGAILTRLPLHQSPVRVDVAARSEPTISSIPDNDSEPYTGLVIDALDMRLERAMGPRIIDEAGRVIYPDPGHVPSDDYVQDHGMVSYYLQLAEAKRAGKHPLVIHALKVSDIGHDDITVSNDAGELIREANRRGKFLWKWSVAVLGGKGEPVAKTPGQ